METVRHWQDLILSLFVDPNEIWDLIYKPHEPVDWNKSSLSVCDGLLLVSIHPTLWVAKRVRGKCNLSVNVSFKEQEWHSVAYRCSSSLFNILQLCWDFLRQNILDLILWNVHATVSVCLLLHEGFHSCYSFLHTIVHVIMDELLWVIYSGLWLPSIDRPWAYFTSTSKASSTIMIMETCATNAHASCITAMF